MHDSLHFSGLSENDSLRNANIPRGRRHGFTLVELLVVVGIIAILIAILLPSLRKAFDSAKATQCMSNLRQLGIGVTLYSTDYRGAAMTTLQPGIPPNPYGLDWQAMTAPYLHVTLGLAPDVYPSVFRCPACKDNRTGLEASGGYAMNPNLDGSLSHLVTPYKLTYIKQPAATINISEAYITGNPVAISLPAAYDIDDFESFSPFGQEWYHLSEPTIPSYQNGTGGARFAHRHMKGTNCLFYDGHVERIRTSVLDATVRNTPDCLWDNN